MPMKTKKASLTTAHASVSVSTGEPFDGVILNEDGVSLNDKAGWDEDESARWEGQMMAPDPPPVCGKGEKQQSTSGGNAKSGRWLTRERQRPHGHDGGRR